MSDIYGFLQEHGIEYEKVEHPAVFTCEEAERIVPPLPGSHTKNLFLRDGKAKRYILVVVDYEKNVDLKELKKMLNADKLSFASPEKLKELMGVDPGSATLLGLMMDTNGAVEVVLDETIWNADALQCHPLINTATLVISHAGIEKFLDATKHVFQVLNVPNRVMVSHVEP